MLQGIPTSAGSTSRCAVVARVIPLLLGACAPISPDEPRYALGTYRIPYVDGTTVSVTQDFWTHGTPKPGMFDLVGSGRSPSLAAAAPGWIRFIEDDNTETGEGTLNNYVWIEHPYPYCQDPTDPARNVWPGKPDDYEDWCLPCDEPFCNEWTVYAHMQTGSTSQNGNADAGLAVGDWVEAGTFIGREGEVGQAYGQHLHWHVAIIDPDVTPNNGYYADWTDGAWYASPELFPYLCAGVFSTVTPFALTEGKSYTARSCNAPREGTTASP